MPQGQAVSLQQSFADTDTVEYGPFKIVKAVGASWEHAAVFANGKQVEGLTPQQKRFISTLVAQKGDQASYRLLDRELPRQEGAVDYSQTKRFHVFAHHVRKALEKTGQDGPQLAATIRSTNPYTGGGEKGTRSREYGDAGYVIRLPAENAAPAA